ncbi:hypothetical protein KI688_004695 [Linnemannia hyalina]|uniref:Uncharacterized protein n=1 Tax=Linnemannia hyalina TaxID=64524 RepID=A0A9P7XKS2_9FUNG|nr:hypothetical protein KI688_004695 [Linnemannia hyalina]
MSKGHSTENLVPSTDDNAASAPLLLVLLAIIYFILLPKLVQSIVNDSQMAMDQLHITEPTETGMKAFSDFAKELLTKEKFVWRLTSVVTVKAFGIIPLAGIDLVKDVTLLVLDLFYEGTYLGQVTAQNATLVGGGSGSPVMMTVAKSVSVKPDGVNPVSWLNDGIMALTLTVPLRSPKPLQIINGIQTMDMGITFNPATPYVPTVLSKSITAGVKFPFNITIHVQTNQLDYVGVLGDIQASVPSQVNSNLQDLIAFCLPSSPLVVMGDAHEDFNTFLADLTIQAEDTFTVVGKSNATAETPVGLVSLTDVPFNSPARMKALNINAQHTTVSDVVVPGGTSEHIIIQLVVTLINPSTLTMVIGNVTLMVFDGPTNQFLGDLVIQNLNIVPGRPTHVPAQFLFHPMNPLRNQFLSRFVVGDIFRFMSRGLRHVRHHCQNSKKLCH